MVSSQPVIAAKKKTKVYDPPGGLRKKLKTIKCLTKKLMEYDVQNDFWNPVEVKTDKFYYPWCQVVYLPNQDMIVIGGLDDSNAQKPTMSERALLI
jgi:hypothetical protein